MTRKPTQRDRVRAWLLEKGSITNVQAVSIMTPGVYRLSERIRELQAEGFKISGDWVRRDGRKTSEFKYTLDARPPEPPKQVVRYVVRDGVRFAQVCYE